MSALTSTALVIAARDAETNVLRSLAAAYSATRDDIAAGNKPAAIGKAWKAARITPASEAIVSDYATAATLTDLGPILWAAITEVEKGGFRKPHAYVTRCREAVKTPATRAIIAALVESVQAIIADDEKDEAAAVKACAAGLRKLLAAKREREEETGEDEATGVESGEDEATAPAAVDPHALLSAAAGPLGRVIAAWQDGTAEPSAADVRSFLELAGRLDALDRRRTERAMRDAG